MLMSIVLKIIIFVIVYIVYIFAGAAVVYLIEDYYDYKTERDGAIISNIFAMVLWPVTSLVFILIEVIKYIRQQLNNKKG